MADDVGQQRRGRGAPRRPRGHRDGWGQGHPQRGDRFQGRRPGRVDDNDTEDDMVQVAEAVAPPRKVRRLGAAALDRMLQLKPEDLLLRITNRVSVVEPVSKIPTLDHNS